MWRSGCWAPLPCCCTAREARSPCCADHILGVSADRRTRVVLAPQDLRDVPESRASPRARKDSPAEIHGRIGRPTSRHSTLASARHRPLARSDRARPAARTLPRPSPRRTLWVARSPRFSVVPPKAENQPQKKKTADRRDGFTVRCWTAPKSGLGIWQMPRSRQARARPPSLF